MECLRCGASARLSEVISNKSNEGIILVCDKCISAESLIKIKRPTLDQIQNVDNFDKGFKDRVKSFEKTPSVVNEVDFSLREIVEKNYEKKISVSSKVPKGLVRNFHWFIMRARQRKKVTPAQMAKDLGESEKAIKFAEKGILPNDWEKLIGKIEVYLGVFLRDEEIKSPFESIRENVFEEAKKNPDEVARTITDRVNSKFITLGDLKAIKSVEKKELKDPDFSSEFEKKKTREEVRKEEFLKSALNPSSKGYSDDEVKKSFRNVIEDSCSKRELSQEEIEKLIFGKK